jgi:hypothetical protein
MVKEGDNYMCIKTLMGAHNVDKKVLFQKGNSYFSESNDFLTSETGTEISIDKIFLEEYFERIPSDSEYEENIGVKETLGKLSYELDFEFITQMAERMDANKGKYEPYNWQKPIETQGLYKALTRHFFNVMKGEYEDDGREFGHLESIALNAMMINYQLRNHRDNKELEKQTDYNMNLISAFADHYKAETGKQVSDEVIYSFFNA